MYEKILDELVSEENLVPRDEQIGSDRIAQIAAEIYNYLIVDADTEEWDDRVRQETMTLYYYLRTGRAIFAIR